ncbi:hypothetical protein AAFF_G00435480 [Aldrovandia affinis]|uniref:Uncharacterized protein n=1 Tax=Aldrovandia affinis TaxID=143900 RepID=A0AAD7WJ15_9TELE|nr:hypothetical protein AAFF_G00435480 [Aldrovandia affinis]
MRGLKQPVRRCQFAFGGAHAPGTRWHFHRMLACAPPAPAPRGACRNPPSPGRTGPIRRGGRCGSSRLTWSPWAAGELGAREHDKLPTTPEPRQRMIFCSEEVKPVFISSSVTRDWGGISFSLYTKSVARGEPR